MKKTLKLLICLFTTSMFLGACGSSQSGTSTSTQCTHEFSDLVQRVDATCEESGHIAYYQCKKCEMYFNEAKEEISLEKIEIPALGHDWKHIDGVAKTCEHDGYRDYYDCSRCEKYSEDDQGKTIFADLDNWKKNAGVIKSTGHNKIVHDGLTPTCYSEGFKEYYECKDCNKLFSDSDMKKEITVDIETWKKGDGKLEKTTHIIGDLIPAKEPTCFEAGCVEHYHCPNCNKDFSDKEGKIIIADVIIPKLDHSMAEHPATPRTCEHDGNSLYYSCSQCMRYYSDEAGNNEISEGSWIIKGGHKMTKHDAVPQTGFATGNDEYYSCELCNKFYSDEAGYNEISEGSWVRDALKTITFTKDTILQETGNPLEYATRSIENDDILFEISGTLTKGNVFASIEAEHYLHIKSPLFGVKSIEISGTGNVFIFNGLVGWDWNNDNIASIVLSSTPKTLKLDPKFVNNFQFYSNSAFTINTLKINIENEMATGVEDDNDITSTGYFDYRTTGDIFNYYNEGCSLMKVSTDTNNSNSSLRLAMETVSQTHDGGPWFTVRYTLNEPIVVEKGFEIAFDAKLISGREWFSIKLQCVDGSFCNLDWNGAICQEVGYNAISQWSNYSVIPTETKTIKAIIFALNPYKQGTEDFNEILLDNMNYRKLPQHKHFAANTSPWSSATISGDFTLLNTNEKSLSFMMKFDNEGTVSVSIAASDASTIVSGWFDVIYANGVYSVLSNKDHSKKYGDVQVGDDGWITVIYTTIEGRGGADSVGLVWYTIDQTTGYSIDTGSFSVI